MKHYDTYLFDWDGTLSQSMALWIAIYHEELERYGVKSSDTNIANIGIGKGGEGARKLGVPEDNLDIFLKHIREKGIVRAPKAPLYPGSKNFLKALRREGKKTGLITANFPEILQQIFDYHELHEFFDILVTAEDVSAPKPDPSGILFALSELGSDKTSSIMIGDNDKDILAAQNAGIDNCLFFPNEHEGIYDLELLKTHQPTFLIHSWQEAINLL